MKFHKSLMVVNKSLMVVNKSLMVVNEQTYNYVLLWVTMSNTG